MATDQAAVSAFRAVDDSGRLLPLTEEEHRARSEAIARAFDELAAITDETDTDELWEEFKRGIDEDRMSDRKRFR